MSRHRLLFMVGVLTVVVIAAFAMPAIANEDMASNTPEDPSLSDGSAASYNAIPVQGAENTAAPVSCWQYSDVFERWEWDCD
jgi:hypothetical protein